ncbi:MAG: phage portal protein, partial [Proteobacteria bacterium]|nr:phage portal protein [Pseudomonadota bacterium]
MGLVRTDAAAAIRASDNLMGLFSILRRRTGPGERKESAAGPLIALSLVGRALWTPRNYEKLADEGYQKNVIAFRCINVVAQGAATVPLMLFDRKGDKEIDTHPLLDLLRRPNPMQGQAEFFEALYAYFLVAGNTYVEAAMPQGKVPTELWTLRPDRMKVVPGKGGIPA